MNDVVWFLLAGIIATFVTLVVFKWPFIGKIKEGLDWIFLKQKFDELLSYDKRKRIKVLSVIGIAVEAFYVFFISLQLVIPLIFDDQNIVDGISIAIFFALFCPILFRYVMRLVRFKLNVDTGKNT